MKNKLSLLLPLLVIVITPALYWVWGSVDQGREFDCRARLYTKLIANACKKSSVIDVFLSMHDDGKGYLLVSGLHSCPKTEPVALRGVVNFTYSRDGGYYSLRLGERSADIIKLFEVLKEDEIKVKITEADNDDYVVSSPIETLLMCTKE